MSLSLLLVTATIASAETKNAEKKEKRPRTHSEKTGRAPRFPFSADRDSFGAIAHALSEQSQRSVAIMNGAELTAQIGPYDSKKFTVEQWMDQLAKDAGLHVQHGPDVDFFYPDGYDALTNGSVAPRLDPAFAELRVTLHFDLDTPLYAALALLSHSLKTAIVADNIVADAHCGQTQLFDVTLAEALDALLHSARVADPAFKVINASGSVFLYSPGHPLREKTFIELPGEPRPGWMDRAVTLYLPAAPAEPEHLHGYANAVPLHRCLEEIAKQTGVKVEADPRLNALPINPTVMVNVPIQTALDLIVNQWPLPHFGYRVTGDTVRFIYLGPPISDATPKK